MFLLRPRQEGNRFPEPRLVLFGKRFAVFEREVGVQVVVERRASLLQRFVLPFGLQNLVDLVLIGARDDLLAGTGAVGAGRTQLLVGLGRRVREVVHLLLGLSYQLGVEV